MPRPAQYMIPMGRFLAWLSRVVIRYSPSSTKEIGPAFEPVVVDSVRVAGEQILDPARDPMSTTGGIAMPVKGS